MTCQVTKTNIILKERTQELEQWRELLAELPLEEDGTRRSTATYGEILKKRCQEVLKAKAKKLHEELKL